MAFGFPPTYIFTQPLDGLSKDRYITLAIKAARALEWSIGTTGNNGFVAHTGFSMSSWSEEVTVMLDADAITFKSKCVGSQIVDWGKNKKNVETLIAAIDELKHLPESEEELLRDDEGVEKNAAVMEAVNNPPIPEETKTGAAGILAIFKPVEGYFVTPILIYINVAVYIIMVASGVDFFMPSSESLINWGANFRPVTLEGEWWRLITSCFLHIGILHLLLNMYALVYIGMLLEPYLGKTRFISAYILTGILASLASLWWHDLTVSAGASGAIFGLYGVFLAMLTTNLIEKSARKALLTSIGVFVVYNLLNGVKGNIDNAAHIGGLLSGIIVGYAYIPGLRRQDPPLKYVTITILALITMSCTYFICKKLPNDLALYDAKIKEFVSMEAMALDVYKLPEDAPKEKVLHEIKTRGLYYWNENIKLINELEKLNLPDVIHEKNKKLLEYCELRIKSYEFIYKAIDEETEVYKDSIIFYNNKIEANITSLKNGE